MTPIRWRQNRSDRPSGVRSRWSAGLRGAGDRDDGRVRHSGDERSDGGIDDERENEQRADDGRGGEPFTTYTDTEYGYRVAYPAEWSVEAEPPGGASFGVNGASDAGVVVFVDESVTSVETHAKAFVDDLRGDEHVHAFEPATRRDVRLASGQPGALIECPYVGETPGETWRFAYLFAVVEGVGYTLGVDWNEADPFGEVATRIIDSFAVETDDDRATVN